MHLGGEGGRSVRARKETERVRTLLEGSNKTAVFTRETQTLKNTLWESYRVEKNGKRKFHQPHPQQQAQPSGTQNT